MARGLPAVAFGSSPGVRELITDGVDGLMAPPGNTTEFAAALARLLASAELRQRLAGAARESVRRFAPGTIAERWDELFNLLCR
jgi:glycosyltransferase involved in cell wall biosynthesis